MSDFTEILSKTIVAFSDYGVTTNNGFNNVPASEMVDRLKQAQIGIKDGSHFLRTGLLLSDNGQCLTRSNNHAESLANLLVLDCDKHINRNGETLEGAPDPYTVSQILRKHDIGHILYGSHSHYTGEKGNRYRIIFFTEKPYTEIQLLPTIETLISLINTDLNGELLVDVKENKSWTQPWYMPRKPAESKIADLYIEYIDGNTVAIHDSIIVPPTKTTGKTYATTNGEISPIHAFNTQYLLTDLLKQYSYKRIYSNGDKEKWLSPNSKSGIAGITVKGNKFFSHHDDAFNDGYWHDAFDLMRISEGLSEPQATIKAAQNTMAPGGQTVDEHNKSLVKNTGKTDSPNFNPIPHNEILKKLLKKIPKINFRKIAEINNDDEKLKKYHYYIIAIETMLETAKKYNWGMCRNHDFIYLFNGAYWNYLDKDDLKAFLGAAAEKMGIEKFYARDFNFREQLYKQFIAVAHLPMPQQPKDIIFVNLKNGTFEITPQGTRLKSFDGGDFLTYQLPFSYDPTATCPIFQAYLDKVLPDIQLQNILAEYIGYIFIRTGTLKLEKALILYGTGANGKSVFYEVIRNLLGENNISEYSLQSLTDEKGYQRAMIANKLLNYASEISSKLETAMFKQLVSGEPVEARLPYGHPFSITDYAKLIFNCNELPRDVEESEAYFRRFLIVPFRVTIDEKDQDKQLAKKIIESELSGVFNWALKGLNRLLAQKQFTDSNIIREARAEYERESDSVRLFLDECDYKPSIEHYIAIKELYREYKFYCQDNGYHPVTMLTFRKRLEHAKIKIDRKSIGNVAFLTKDNNYSRAKSGE